MKSPFAQHRRPPGDLVLVARDDAAGTAKAQASLPLARLGEPRTPRADAQHRRATYPAASGRLVEAAQSPSVSCPDGAPPAEGGLQRQERKSREAWLDEVRRSASKALIQILGLVVRCEDRVVLAWEVDPGGRLGSTGTFLQQPRPQGFAGISASPPRERDGSFARTGTVAHFELEGHLLHDLLVLRRERLAVPKDHRPIRHRQLEFVSRRSGILAPGTVQIDQGQLIQGKGDCGLPHLVRSRSRH